MLHGFQLSGGGPSRRGLLVLHISWPPRPKHPPPRCAPHACTRMRKSNSRMRSSHRTSRCSTASRLVKMYESVFWSVNTVTGRPTSRCRHCNNASTKASSSRLYAEVDGFGV